eukprot:2945445-Rhodomonas_salina.4
MEPAEQKRRGCKLKWRRSAQKWRRTCGVARGGEEVLKVPPYNTLSTARYKAHSTAPYITCFVLPHTTHV